MSRTPPSLTDLVPELRAAVEGLAADHEAAFPERCLCLIWAHRSPEEQRAAFVAKSSKLDGFERYSLHNFCPSFAADLWVYTSGYQAASLFVDRPPRAEGFRLQIKRGTFRPYYRPMGLLAERHGLEWGGRWRHLGDGPHVQLPKRLRVKLVQEALQRCGFNPGPADGIDGKRTALAVAAASGMFGINGIPTKRQRKLMPVTPALWARLNDWHQ